MRHGVFSGVITRARCVLWSGGGPSHRRHSPRIPPSTAGGTGRAFLPIAIVRFNMFCLKFCLFDLNFCDYRLNESVCVACWVRGVDWPSTCPLLGVCGSCVCSSLRPLWRLTFWITLAAGKCLGCFTCFLVY